MSKKIESLSVATYNPLLNFDTTLSSWLLFPGFELSRSLETSRWELEQASADHCVYAVIGGRCVTFKLLIYRDWGHTDGPTRS